MKPITIATNTGANTLEYTKLLLKSLKDNLDSQDHEILVFVDNDNDGTVEYLRSIKNDFKDLKIITHKITPFIGYARNSTLLVELAKYDIVSYLQSDMVISKHYDTLVLKDLEDNTILTSTRIEPPLHGESPVTFTKNFGLSPKEFNYNQFLDYAETVKSNKIIDYFFAPYTFHKETWLKLGGYDTMYRRSREDSDFVQRCLQAGVKIKQTYSANVYHFTCVSSRGVNWFKDWYDKENIEGQKRAQLQSIADQIEIRRFVRKWGNFNHGESLLKKYDIDLVVKGSNQNLELAYQLEPFFSRVWVQSEEDQNKLIKANENQQEPANILHKFSSEEWEKSKKYYNQIDYSGIYKIGDPEDFNVKIILDTDKEDENFLTENVLKNLSTLLDQTESGDYEFGNCIISINKLQDVTAPYKVENPSFDMSLLEIE